MPSDLDLVGLVLVDTKTRTRAAVLLSYEQAHGIRVQRTRGVKIISAAKSGPLIATLRNLLRNPGTEIAAAGTPGSGFR